MSGQGDTQTVSPQRPSNNDPKAWQVYWEAHGQPWRTEPEIDKKRQTYLAQRRALVTDIEKGLYPFRDIKLSRADIEWLLATLDNGRGPIDWDVESQRERRRLDVRGANLCQIDLSGLPLACLCGGLTWNEWLIATKEQQTTASVKMNNAVIGNARLEGAILYGAELKGIALYGTQLEGAKLGWAQLEEADLGYANFHATDLREAKLQRVLLFMANLEGADLREADFRGADLRQTNLKRADLTGANLEGVKIGDVILAGKAGIGPWLADIQWGGANLAAVDWSQVAILGEEYQVQQKKAADGTTKNASSQLYEHKAAVRANRQLAVALQVQGLNEEAARFAYRSQLWKQRLLFLQLLQQIAGTRILRWLLRTPQKSPEYLYTLAGATLLLIFAIVAGLLPIISSRQALYPSWLIVAAFSVGACFCLLLLLAYQPVARLLLVFLFLSALDLILLYFVFYFLVNTLSNPEWRINLLFLLLLVVMMTMKFWQFYAGQLIGRSATRISFSDRVKHPRNISIKIYRAFFRPWLVPLTQLQVNYGRYVFALFLNLLAGYGFKPGRTLFWYLVVIFGFATSYYAIGHMPLLPNAFVLSLTSFHGRGFFPGLESKTALDNPLVVLAAIEAVVGLFIEISFIATFTQRFFGK